MTQLIQQTLSFRQERKDKKTKMLDFSTRHIHRDAISYHGQRTPKMQRMQPPHLFVLCVFSTIVT